MTATPPKLSTVDKRALLSAIDRQLAIEIAAATSRAKATAASATHDEARAEDDKDTRAIEESYLARGQAQRVADLEYERGLLRTVEIHSLEGMRVAVGALVRLEDDDDMRFVFVVPAGGGRRVDVDGLTVQLVTPLAPLGAALIGCAVDDDIELTLRGQKRGFTIVDLG